MNFLEEIEDFVNSLGKYLVEKIPHRDFVVPTISAILGFIALIIGFRANREVVIFILWSTSFLSIDSFLVFLVRFSLEKGSIPGIYRFPIRIRGLTITLLLLVLAIETSLFFSATNNGFVNVVFNGTQTPTPTITPTITSTVTNTPTLTSTFTSTFTVTTSPTATFTRTVQLTPTKTQTPIYTATLSPIVFRGLYKDCIPAKQWFFQDYQNQDPTESLQSNLCVNLDTKGISAVPSGLILEVSGKSQDIMSLSTIVIKKSILKN